MRSFSTDFRWQARFMPEVTAVLARHLIVEAPYEEDAFRNTDLMVLGANSLRVACRIRKHKYFASYGDEFTLRCGRPSGVKTELVKVIEGWGDYLFYGFSSPDEQSLAGWFLGDLAVFRLWHSRALRDHCTPGRSRVNGDQTQFQVYRLGDLPSEFVVDRAEPDGFSVASEACGTGVMPLALVL